jgi:hypothetical protein
MTPTRAGKKPPSRRNKERLNSKVRIYKRSDLLKCVTSLEQIVGDLGFYTVSPICSYDKTKCDNNFAVTSWQISRHSDAVAADELVRAVESAAKGKGFSLAVWFSIELSAVHADADVVADFGDLAGTRPV